MSTLMMNSASMPVDDLLLDGLFEFDAAFDDFPWQDNSNIETSYEVPQTDVFYMPTEGDEFNNFLNDVTYDDENLLDALLDDEDMAKEVYSYACYVANQYDFGSHFYRNVNVMDLSDSMVECLEAFYKRKIDSVKDIAELKVVLEKICLQKAPLVKALGQISSISEPKLKEEMKDSRTSKTRCLLLALVVNRAMQILDGTRPKTLIQYSNQLDCEAEFSDLWRDYSDFSEIDLVTKCMAVFKVVHHELQLDCSHGKKGLVITAAIMIADAQRTYTNGGSQARWVKVLEEMFHRITGCTVKPRGTKRSADEMSSDSE